MRFDRSKEGAHSAYCIVLKDSETYKMYYRDTPESGAGDYACYAKSDDGIHWEKPNSKPVRVRFVMKDTDLFSIKFNESI